MKIFKYFIYDYQDKSICMPKGAEILTAQIQGDEIVVWAKVSEDSRTENVTISVVGTGREFNDANKRYIATVQSEGFVWHVFEHLHRS